MFRLAPVESLVGTLGTATAARRLSQLPRLRHHGTMQDSEPRAGAVTLCVLLWARPGAEAGLIAYEDEVLGIASGYGGRVLQRARTGGADGQPLEVQLLEFPSAQAVEEFMADGRRQSLAGERDRVVARTEVIDVQLVRPDPGP